ncbi:MAG: patatin-like phospholipase family protein [Cloacibacillus sp.]
MFFRGPILKYLSIFLSAAAMLAATGSLCAAADEAEFAPYSRETREHMQSWGFPHKEGVVLVLCGGGMKGLSHIGVFEVLAKNDIPVAAIIGTSMGAIMGGLYGSGYTTEEMRAMLADVDLMEVMSGRSGAYLNSPGYNRPKAVDDSLFSVTVDKDKNEQGRLGALNAKDLYAFLSDLTSDVAVTDFDQLPIPFAAVATNLGNGDTVILRNGNLASALRASMSIPVIFDPWPMNGMLLVDGGLKANLPVIEAKKLFPGHPIVAVNLSDEDISKGNEEFRTMFDVAAQTLDILMVGQIRRNLEQADVVIAPDLRGIGTFSSQGYDKIIDRGVAAAEAKIPELRMLVADKCHTWDHSRAPRPSRRTLTVAEVRFEGVPEGVAEALHKKYESWIGKPLDMKLVAQTVAKISSREDVKSVDGHTVNLSRNKVAVVFQIERPAKYAFGIDGFASNLYPNRWVSLSAIAHDTFMPGDSASLEYRLGTNWGAMLRYFTQQNENDAQLGLVLSARQEDYKPQNFGYAELERYSAKAAWYKSVGSRSRLGLGYAAERVTSLGTDDKNDHGPYMSFSFNTLDDPIMPTSGLVFNTDLWYRVNYNLISETQFRTYMPLFKKSKVILAGGLKTGDANDLAYAATLGTRQELYSLGYHPMVGDQAYWVHLGFEKVYMRSWWGGINLELFGNYGQVMRDWSNSGSRWEVGAALSVPMNNFNGKLLLIYDQDGGFTIGYSVGIPRFWDGPLP